MMAARELALTKRGVRIVNCARGGIVNEGDLLAALDSGHVAGAAIDVWSEEPPRSEVVRRLIQHPRMVVTPHLGANSGEAQVNVAVDVARQLVAFRDGALVEHAVNIPIGDPAAVAELRPFVALAERLGRFSVQLDPERLARVDITLAGAIAESDPELLARAVLAGLLGPVMAGPVNLVNARLVAAERGVEVRIERQPETTGYKSVVSIAAETSDGRKITAGTVFDGQPRIVRLRDLDIEFAPEGYILVLSYEDRPGMVGRIGSILGRENVNIASMHVGRRIKRGRAIVVLILDENLTPGQVTEVAGPSTRISPASFGCRKPEFLCDPVAPLIGSEHEHSTYARRVPRPRAHGRVRHHVGQIHSQRVRRHPGAEGAHVPAQQVHDHRVAHGEGRAARLSGTAGGREPERRDANHAGGERLAPCQQHLRRGAWRHAGLREVRELARGSSAGRLVVYVCRADGQPRSAASHDEVGSATT